MKKIVELYLFLCLSYAPFLRYVPLGQSVVNLAATPGNFTIIQYTLHEMINCGRLGASIQLEAYCFTNTHY